MVDSQNANALWIVFTYPVLQLGPYLENILVIEQIFAGITTHAKLVKFTLGPNIHPWLGSTMVEPLLSYPQHGVSSVRGHIALGEADQKFIQQNPLRKHTSMENGTQKM